MPLRIPVVVEFPDEALAEIRAAIEARAKQSASTAAKRPDSVGKIELPPKWEAIEEDHGVRYTWGEDQDVYDPFITYEATTSEGTTRMAIGKCPRTRVHGGERFYYIVMNIGPEGGMRAIAEFLATDDYEETHEVIAIIKGKEGSGRQFDSADELPPIYRGWKTVTYRDRVNYPSSFLKQGLVCKEDDAATMLNHSLAQIRLRGL